MTHIHHISLDSISRINPANKLLYLEQITASLYKNGPPSQKKPVFHHPFFFT